MSRIGHHIARLSEVGTLRKPIFAAAVTAFITGSVIAAELAPIEAAGIMNALPAEAGKVWTTGQTLVRGSPRTPDSTFAWVAS